MSFRDRNGRRTGSRSEQPPDWTQWSDPDAPAEPPVERRSSVESDDELLRWLQQSERPRRPVSQSRPPFEPIDEPAERVDEPRRQRLADVSRSLGGALPSRRRQHRPGLPDETPGLNPRERWDDELGWLPVEETEPAPRTRRPSQRGGSGTRARSVSSTEPRRRAARRPGPTLAVPSLLGQSRMVADRLMLMLIGVQALSLILMVALISARMGSLPETVALHLNAAGEPDDIGGRGELWRLPLGAAMLTLMNGVVGWFLASREAFLSRFVLGASLLVHALAWVAVIHLFW